jgi:hypothetical protein
MTTEIKEINHRWVENPQMCGCENSSKEYRKSGITKCKYPATYFYKNMYFCARHMGPFLLKEKLNEQRLERAAKRRSQISDPATKQMAKEEHNVSS